MIVFRLICVILVSWAINLVLSRPEAAVLIEEVPEMAIIGPLAGAVVGLMYLPKRRGGGVIVMTVSGAVSGGLTIALASFVYLTIQMSSSVMHGLVRDFENFLRITSTEAKPLIEALPNLRLMGMLVGATAVAGFVSEVIYWFIERIRRLRGIEETKVQAKSTVGKAGGPLS
jgi:hypothetical protein